MPRALYRKGAPEEFAADALARLLGSTKYPVRFCRPSRTVDWA